MPVQVRCPNPKCGKPARVADDYLGRTVRCPACRETFKVSEPNEASQSAN